MSELSYQEKTVYERLTASNEQIVAATKDIRGRANFITAASTAVVGVITAAKFLPNDNASEGVEFFLLALVCFSSIAIYGLVAQVWRGGLTSLSGPTDVDMLDKRYIGKNPNEAYRAFLSDLCKSAEQNIANNTQQSRRLDRIISVFMLQLALLASSIGWASFKGFF